jgi:hypothetical protein
VEHRFFVGEYADGIFYSSEHDRALGAERTNEACESRRLRLFFEVG